MAERKERASDASARSAKGGRIAFQGEPGANSHIAAQEMFPDLSRCPARHSRMRSAAVKAGDAKLAMIPIENSVAGRVADIHHLLPEAGLYIVGEHFLRVRHQLMALPGTPIGKIKRAMSHTQALGQCRNTLRGSASSRCRRRIRRARRGSCRSRRIRRSAAIASELAAENLRPRNPQARHRGRGPQHHAVRRALARARRRRARRWSHRHHLHLQCPQRAGRALQGDGGLRDDGRQHDEARIATSSTVLSRPPCSIPTSRAIRAIAMCSWRSRSCRSSRRR